MRVRTKGPMDEVTMNLQAKKIINFYFSYDKYEYGNK